MPLYCSNTGSTALREADVQQPMTAAHLSLTKSFFAFSAKVGQSLAPSSWMNLILRPSTPPAALISSDMITPFVCKDALLARRGLLKLCSAQIRKIAYIAPQNSDVDLHGLCKRKALGSGVPTWQ